MNQIMKLLADNRSAPRRFEIVNTGDEATIYLYDVVVSDAYFGGVSATDFVKELNAISSPVIHLRINSPGGDVFAARAIEQALREHKSKVVAHIDGYAASAASYIALAADEIIMAPGSFYMIHKAWTVAYGNADDLMETASLLEKVDASLVDTYAKESGQDAEQIRAWMAAETWFTAAEAVEYGFASSVAENSPKAKAEWNLSAYAKAPEQKAPKSEEPKQEEPKPEEPDFGHLLRNLEIAEPRLKRIA